MTRFALILILVSCGGASPPPPPPKSEPPAREVVLGPSVDAGIGTTTTEVGDGGAGVLLSPVADDGGKVGKKGGEPGRGVEDVRMAILAKVRDKARACYDKALKAHPGIAGDLVIQWVIDPHGKVKDVELDTARSQIVEPEVVKCITPLISDLEFSPSQKGVETQTSYPFNFRPEGRR